jgi:ComF family protein
VLERILDFVRGAVAPPRCVGCGAAGASPFCVECRDDAPEPVFGELEGLPLWAAGWYDGPLARGIRRFKYDPRPELARPLAALLASPAEQMSLPRSALWVPVPLHYARLCERGFNQSALLAQALARRSRSHCAARLLIRHRETAQQAELGKSSRQRNTEGAFSVRSPTDAEVVLVDDVVTTGATLRACIFALREKGVKVRAVFTLARTPPL